MAQRYKILYGLGITPWDHEQAPEQLRNLTDEWAMPLGRALDIGCGTGSDAVYLAEHGWAVTAVDGVGQARATLQTPARHRARNLQQGG